MTPFPTGRLPARSAWSRLACVTAVLTAMVSTVALAQPANEPLLTRAPAVRPNLLFVLDDSGSMGNDIPNDLQGRAVFAPHYATARDAAPGEDCPGINLVRLTEMPINNLLYYDSTKVYEPGFDNNGVQLPPAVVDPAWFEFFVYRPKPGQNILALTTKAEKCDPARYDAIRVLRWNFSINGIEQSANPLPSSPNRTDCNGGTGVAVPCTVQQEKQNISNYMTWHSNRLKAARAGIAKAFSTQPDTFRLGYTTIHVADADPNGSGVGSAKLWGVKDYGLAKSEFYTWLNRLTTSGNTPLRKALDIAGQYYSRSGNDGPWAHRPWVTNSDGEAPTGHLSCRRNFTILVTDGEWNSSASPTPGSAANVDGVPGPTIAHSNGLISYQYRPRDTDLRSVGKADRSAGGTATDWGNTLADVAMYYWNRDLRPDLLNNASPGKQTDKPFWQNMTTFTAAFGPIGRLTGAQVAQARAGQVNWTSVQPSAATPPETVDDLIHAAHNGGGEFLTLTDAASFANEIGRVVNGIAGEQFSQAGVAASAVTLTAGTKKFVPYYTANSWWGNLKMIELSVADATRGDEIGMVWEVVQTDVQGNPTGASKIAPPATRPIYTWTPVGKGTAFTWANLSPSMVASSTSTNTVTLLNNAITPDIVNFLRGDRSKEGPLPQPFRVRQAVLGDIVNSTPVFIKNNSNFRYERLPAATPGYGGYLDYMNAKRTRPEGVLFVGANDGMVHGFREGVGSTVGGSETFAYIPQGVFGQLHTLASKNYGPNHRFFVDGPLSESDAYIAAPNLGGSGNIERWANLVLGSAGAGGRSVFALDVTKPLDMGARSVLWEANSSRSGMGNLGFVMNQVETGVTVSGDWVAIVGNGPYGDSGRASLFILNLADGSVLREIPTSSETGNGLGGVRIVRNDKSQIIGAYAGDLKGNVWRFDLSADTRAGWPSSGQLLFTARDSGNVAQPITATPGVVPRPDALGGYMVVIGTGKLYDSADQVSTQTQAAYGLWDKSTFGGSVTFSGIPSISSLISINVALDTSVSSTATSDTNPDGVTRFYKTTVSRTPDWVVDRGWYIDYTLTPGQRTIFSVEPTSAVVRIDTIAPRASLVSCAASTSQGFNYLVKPLTGTCKTNATFDTNNDGAFTDTDSRACIYSTDADGEDVVLAIPGQTPGQDGNVVDIHDSQGHIPAQVCEICGPLPTPVASQGVTRSWRQIFMRPQ